MIVWGLTAKFRTEVPGIGHDDSTARSAAREMLDRRGIELDALLSALEDEDNFDDDIEEVEELDDLEVVELEE